MPGVNDDRLDRACRLGGNRASRFRDSGAWNRRRSRQGDGRGLWRCRRGLTDLPDLIFWTLRNIDDEAVRVIEREHLVTGILGTRQRDADDARAALRNLERLRDRPARDALP